MKAFAEIRERMFLAGLIALASLLLLTNLGNHYLWQDEAETALVAKTVMTHGIPYGTDGTNYFSQNRGAEYGADYIWKWHPWLQYYLVAGSFKLFGVNTLAARLPFVLFGIAMAPLLYFFTRNLWKDRRAAGAATLLLLFCVPFLILIRQCRYYSPAAFFSVLGLFAYHRLLNGRRLSIPLFITAGILLFHTNYVYAASLLTTATIHCLCFHRSKWRQVGLACSGTVLLSAPWMLWLSLTNFSKVYGWDSVTFFTAASGCVQLMKNIGYVFPVYLLAAPPAIFLVHWLWNREIRVGDRAMWSAVAIPLLFSCFTVVFLSLAGLTVFFRYLCPAIPPMLAISGLIVSSFFNFHRAVGIIVLALTMVFQQLSFRPMIVDFAYELTHDYKGPIKGMVNFLNANASPGDIVAITYGDMPLKFYTPLRIVGGLTGEDLSPSKDAKWVIFRHNAGSSKDHTVREYLIQNLDFHNYRKIEIDYPDILYENRESPTEHQFRTATCAPHVLIFERMQPDSTGIAKGKRIGAHP